MAKHNIKIKAESITLQTLLDNIQIISFYKEYDESSATYVYKVGYKIFGTLAGFIEKRGIVGSISYENCKGAVVDEIKSRIGDYMQLSLG